MDSEKQDYILLLIQGGLIVSLGIGTLDELTNKKEILIKHFNSSGNIKLRVERLSDNIKANSSTIEIINEYNYLLDVGKG